MGRRPSESDIDPEHVVIKVAPISDMATINPSRVGWVSNFNSLFIYKRAPAAKVKEGSSKVSTKKTSLTRNKA